MKSTKKNWRRNCIWIKNDIVFVAFSNAIDEFYIERFAYIVKLIDSQIRENDCSNVYIEMLIQLYKWKNNDDIYHIHDITKMKSWLFSLTYNSKILKKYRIYNISKVLHDAHLISKKLIFENKILFVNNWINYEQYNKIFNSKFFERNKTIAKK